VWSALVVLTALVLTGTARAWDHDGRLDALASRFAGREIVVQCATRDEDPQLTGNWGWTSGGPASWVRVDRRLCDAALGQLAPGEVDATTDPRSWQALGIATVVHEAYHQRLSWASRRDEGNVECKAIRHFVVATRLLLGWTESQARGLLPDALFWYWQQTSLKDVLGDHPYRAACDVPFWLPPGEITE
jgi:hypothetical protein